MRFSTALVLFSILTPTAVLAEEQASSASKSTSEDGRPVIVISDPKFRPFPMAVPDTRVEEGGDEFQVLAETLRWDFDISILFEFLDPKSYLPDPQKESMLAGEIAFEDWLNVGAEGLIKSRAERVSSERVKVELGFFDVASGRRLLEATYEVPPSQLRTAAHRFANEVVRLLTGKPGIFGTRIAAVRKLKSSREIWVVNMDGSGAKAVTRNGSINLLPTWTPDGSALLFTSFMGNNPSLYRVPVGGGKATLVSGRQGLNTGADVSPDGRRVALTMTRDGNSEIYVMDLDGSNLQRLTNQWAIDSSPSWSPDGKRIAFVSSRWGDPHIFVMDADGSNVERLTERGTYNQTPDWSPRGDVVAFTARDERNVFDIFTVNVKTKEIRRLTQDQGNNEEPSFSPDGNNIVFQSTREGRSQLWIMGVDGSNQRRLTRGGGYLTPQWSPRIRTNATAQASSVPSGGDR